MKRIGHFVAVMASMTILFFPASSASAGQEYRIIMMMGDVRIVTGGAAHAAEFNEKLGGGEVIITGGASMADISMGGRGYLRVRENSKVSLASLKKGANETDLSMDKGNVIVIMSKLKKSDSYEVKSSTTVASVRGTMFQVNGDEEKSEINVFGGTVMANPVVNGKIERQISEMITEGQCLALDRTMVVDILSRKKKMKMSEIRREVREAFMNNIRQIQSTPQYQKQSQELRREIDSRVEKFKQELKDRKLDRESIKEKLQDERQRQKQERERQRKELRKMRDGMKRN